MNSPSKSAPSTEPAGPAPPSISRLDSAVGAFIGLYAVILRLGILYVTRVTTEDFYITLRYAENLARGHGMVYNAGERVLGVTTPLYTLLLAAADWSGLPAEMAGKALNILAAGVTCWVIVTILAALGRPREGWFAALLYAATSAPINFSIGGMETALVTLAASTAILAYVRGRPVAMWASLAVLFLLRIDGLLLTVVLAGGWAVQRKGIPTKGMAIAAAIALPWILFATVYFGSPIPASMTAKLVAYGRTVQGALPNLVEFRTQFFAGWPQKALLAGFLVGIVAAWRQTPALRAPVAWLALHYTAMFASRVPAFGWYFVPPLPLYYAVACIGIGAVLGLVRERSRMLRPLSPAAAITVLLAAAVPFTIHLRSIEADLRAAQRVEDEVRKPIGLWLRANAGREERIMLEPIGYIGYFSGLRVLDDVGLVSPEALKYYRREVPFPLVAMVERERPDLALLRFSEREEFRRARPNQPDERLLPGYRFVRAWPDAESGPMFFLYRRE